MVTVSEPAKVKHIWRGKGLRETIPLPYGVKIPAFLYAVISMDRANTVLLGSSSIIRNKNCKILRHVQNMMIAAGNVPMSSRMFSFFVSTDPWIEDQDVVCDDSCNFVYQ